jgi:hypothetical protein
LQVLIIASALATFAGSGVGAVADQAPASAATPSSNKHPEQLQEVTVTAHRLDQHTLDHVIIPRFVRSHGAPNPISHQVGRWALPWTICPKTTGLEPAYADFVSRRIIAVAKLVGAPTAANAQCKASVEIIFTPDPQAQLNYFATTWRAILGNPTGTWKDLVTFNHQIRAWYEAETKTAQGWGRDYDDPLMDPNLQATSLTGNPLPYNVEEMGRGSRISSGITAGFANVLVIVDSNQARAHSVNSIADYIAVLVLSRTALDGCNELPSIIDLFSPDCGGRPAPETITSADIAFLKALYSANLENNLNLEQRSVHDRMLHEVLGR